MFMRIPYVFCDEDVLVVRPENNGVVLQGKISIEAPGHRESCEAVDGECGRCGIKED